MVSGAKPALSLGSYAAFTRYRDGQALLMGDLVVTEAEPPAVTDAIHGAGLAQTAIHKHLLAHEPQLWWTHVHALGDPLAAARGVRSALDRTGTPTAAPPNTAPGDLATAALHDQPRLFYLHFWAHTDAQALARTLRTAIDATRTAA